MKILANFLSLFHLAVLLCVCNSTTVFAYANGVDYGKIASLADQRAGTSFQGSVDAAAHAQAVNRCKQNISAAYQYLVAFHDSNYPNDVYGSDFFALHSISAILVHTDREKVSPRDGFSTWIPLKESGREFKVSRTDLLEYRELSELFRCFKANAVGALPTTISTVPGLPPAAKPTAPAATPPSPKPLATNDAQYSQRVVKTYSSVIFADNVLMASPNLTGPQKSLVSIWSINLRKDLIDLMPTATITPEFANTRNQLIKLKEGRVKGCGDAVSASDKKLCLDGAFFGSADQRADIERAGLKPKPPEEKQPKLKRVPTDVANQCLALEPTGLFGGFINSCNHAVMVVWCIENPSKEGWGDAFRCVNRSSTNALEVVGANTRITAHTRGGNVVMFACAWQSKSGAGPDGIWGQTTYNEGVGTSGVIRGTCGEQVFVPG